MRISDWSSDVCSSDLGAGLGRIFYADLQSFAEVRSPRIACEVFLEPGNDIALLFHGTYGFNEVGQQLMPAVERRVSLLTKELCSWPWVQQTYYSGEHSRLPELPWRSEEHTSELQSPMRTSYAVLCLKN